MTRTRLLALLAIGCLFAGCSESPSSGPRTSAAVKARRVAANEVVQARRGEAPANSGKIVQATHVESQSPAPQTASVPSLLEGLSESGFNEHPRGGCEEASQALGEAMKTLKTKLAVISNNLANAETIGFKRSRVAIESCPYEQLKLPGAQDAFNNYAPASIAIGRGCRVQSVEIDFAQGPLKETGRMLDVAVEGEGFFYVEDPSINSFVYTRAGNFAVNSNGLVVVGSASTGRVVQPRISIPTDVTGIVISSEGNVSIQQFGQTQFSQVGQLQLAKFPNPQGLMLLGENLYQETLASGKPIFGQPGLNGLGKLRQSALERSNVDFDEELLAWQATDRTLKSLQRLFEASAP